MSFRMRLLVVSLVVVVLATGCYAGSFRAGGVDPAGNFLGGRETMTLVTHGGKVFAATSYWNDVPGTDPVPGAQILRLDAANAKWRQDWAFGPATQRADILKSVTFTTTVTGAPVNPPVTMLIAGLATVGGYKVATRNDATSTWTTQTIAPAENLSNPTRALGFARVGAVDRVLAGYGDGTPATSKSIISGGYDPTVPGRIRWDAAPEAQNLDGRMLGFAVANGVIHAVSGAKIYARSGPLASPWVAVHTDAATEACDCAGLRGITAIPNPDGPGEVLLFAGREEAANIWRIDPANGYAATKELDVNAFVKGRFGAAATAEVVAYNDFTPVTDPRTGQRAYTVSLFFYPNNPAVDTANAGFLVRLPDRSYELREVPYLTNPNPQTPEVLISSRTFVVSPFPEHGAQFFYLGGHDAFLHGHNTAWIHLAGLEAAIWGCVAPAPTTPYAVGITDLPNQLVDPARSRAIPVRAYYPQGVTGSTPVVIVSHGGTGVANSHQTGLRYLGEALARAGYVALHPNHTSTTPRIDRPLDVKYVLDRLDAGFPTIAGFQGTLDRTRVGEAGHSWGSYTTLVVGGATTDLGAFGTDSRPKAFLGLSPQGAGQFGFTAGSWSNTTRPTYTMFGTLEADGPAGSPPIAPMWRRQPYDGMPRPDKYLSILPGANHDDFGGGTSAIAVQTQTFVAANAVAFFDTYVRGDRTLSCQIGYLNAPSGYSTLRK